MMLIGITAAALAVPEAVAQFGEMPTVRQQEPTSAADLVRVRYDTDVETIAPGSTFTLIVSFDIEPKWHVYWKNPGASGMGTMVEVKAPAGFTVGAPLFPRPIAISSPEGVTFGYEHHASVFIPMVAPEVLATESVSFDVTVDFLVCKTACLLGSAEKTVTRRVSSGTPKATELEATIVTARNRLPVSLKDRPEVELTVLRNRLQVRFPHDGESAAAFFPGLTPGVEYGEAVIDRDASHMTMTIPLSIKAGNTLGEPLRIEGLVALGDDPDDPSFEFSRRLDTSGSADTR